MDYLDIIRKTYNLSPTKNVGYTEKEVFEAESKLKVRFSQILKNFYLELGKCKDVNESFNRLLNLKEEIGFSDDRYLVFYEENQASIHWGIREADLELENPPVYGNYDAVNLSEAWFLENPSLSDFLLSMALWNGVLGGLPYNAIAAEQSINTSILSIIENNWTEITTKSKSRFFKVDDTSILALSFRTNQVLNGIFIGAKHKKTYKEILKMLPLEWEYKD